MTNIYHWMIEFATFQPGNSFILLAGSHGMLTCWQKITSNADNVGNCNVATVCLENSKLFCVWNVDLLKQRGKSQCPIPPPPPAEPAVHLVVKTRVAVVVRWSPDPWALLVLPRPGGHQFLLSALHLRKKSFQSIERKCMYILMYVYVYIYISTYVILHIYMYVCVYIYIRTLKHDMSHMMVDFGKSNINIRIAKWVSSARGQLE